jgi:hypothetical protein
LGKNALGSIELSLTQSTPPEPEATKNCDFCGEKILAIAKKCRHCGSMLDGSHAANSQNAVEPDIKPPEEITPPRTDGFVDNTLSYKVDSAIKKAVNTVMTRLTVFYSSYRTKNNTHNLQEISETLNKFAWFELIKNHSLKSKIIYIVIAFIAIKVGLLNLFAGIFILLLPLLWLVALFNPSITLSNTRMQASKRILLSFILVVVAVGVLRPLMPQGKYHNIPSTWTYYFGSDVEFDEKGNLIKEGNLSMMDRIFGNDVKINEKGNVLEKEETNIITGLWGTLFGVEGIKSLDDGQVVRESKEGLFPYLLVYLFGSDAEYDDKGSLIKKQEVSIWSRIFGNDLELDSKGNVIQAEEGGIFSRDFWLGSGGRLNQRDQFTHRRSVGVLGWIRQNFDDDKVKNE